MDTPSTYRPAGLGEVRRLGSQDLVAAVEALSPGLAHLLVDVALGDVLGRPDLDTRTRELLAVAMLAATGEEPAYVAVHARGALDAGASPTEVVEVVLQTATFAGFPRALRALDAVREAVTRDGAVAARSARAVVVDFLDALGAGDTARALALVAEDAVWQIPGDPTLLPWAGRHEGRPAVERFYGVLGEETEPESVDVGPVVAHGDTVLARGEFAYRFPRTGGHYAGAFVIVFTVRDGAITHYEMHEDSLGLARGYGAAS